MLQKYTPAMLTGFLLFYTLTAGCIGIDDPGVPEDGVRFLLRYDQAAEPSQEMNVAFPPGLQGAGEFLRFTTHPADGARYSWRTGDSCTRIDEPGGHRSWADCTELPPTGPYRAPSPSDEETYLPFDEAGEVVVLFPGPMTIRPSRWGTHFSDEIEAHRTATPCSGWEGIGSKVTDVRGALDIDGSQIPIDGPGAIHIAFFVRCGGPTP